jgi:thioredoxin-dependent peroxiredoxin
MTLLARFLLGCSLAGMLPSLAWAELKIGTAAPAFSSQAAQGGTDLTFTLSAALEKGPVVVYFYPKSFTAVCTEEAHLFAEAMAEFEKLGASVIGISTDTIETQREFSRMACRDKFPVAADPKGEVVEAYDVLIRRDGGTIFARRTSYVVTPDGKIASVLNARDAATHIETALAFVKGWKERQMR